uniref:sucrose synthase n=1 Tax=Aegilops tauschii subsp. strangulata TaxID=200361 RepID=A0A453Q7W1_AEGTS
MTDPSLLCRYVSKGRRLMRNQQLMEELEASAGDDKPEKARLAEGFLGYVICSTQEAVVLPPLVAFAVRTNPGVWEFIRVHSGDLSVEEITPSAYLKCKETLYDEKWYCIINSSIHTTRKKPDEPRLDWLLLLFLQGARRQLAGGRFQRAGPLHASSDAAVVHRQRDAVRLPVHVVKAERQAGEHEAAAGLPAKSELPRRGKQQLSMHVD